MVYCTSIISKHQHSKNTVKSGSLSRLRAAASWPRCRVVKLLASLCHTQSSLWSYQLKTCSKSYRMELWSCDHSLLQCWEDGAKTVQWEMDVTWQVGCGVRESKSAWANQDWHFSAPCSNKTALGKWFHLAGLWLPCLRVMIRVYTSRCYCVSKMPSPLPGRWQEVTIIAWHVFLLHW